MDIVMLIGNALKFIFPAYCANAIPVIGGGGSPIDHGKKFFDQKPIFGENKTVRGFISGLIVGTMVGFLESFFLGTPIFLGFLLSLGALFGDLTGAFIKRRLGLAPGKLLPIVDQTDFILGALLFTFSFYFDFFSWRLIVTMLMITPPIHLFTNFMAYKLGLKKAPW